MFRSRTLFKALPPLVCILVLTLGSPAQAESFGGILPSGSFVHKEIISLRERRYSSLVQQQTDFSCGAASLATILRYAYGLDVTEADVLDGLFAVSDPQVVQQQGFSLLNIKHYVERVGFRGRGYVVNAKTLDELKIPTIVLLDLNGYKHFVVLKKSADGLVYLADPALGNKIMPKDEFMNNWNGIVFAVIGKGFNRESTLLNPPPPLTTRGLINVFAPITNAELLEYGFGHTDLL
ncbi:C39 family peptidase [Marinobacterium stanieri]|uniref:Peptidase C39 domain-containing protein n=1 Tax=Marinobacterium stanieri TaxID=49186 RepID=A0A1N6X7Y1_9GAMM|nr:C39 family peptidase [Marinobacterium stanieri]SIQ98379.1 hypothetical protein SAMN05421647_1134 [Marinobacterium stanieri]